MIAQIYYNEMTTLYIKKLNVESKMSFGFSSITLNGERSCIYVNVWTWACANFAKFDSRKNVFLSI